MKKDLLEVVMKNDLQSIKTYTKDGKDVEKLIDLMTLGKDEKSKKDIGMTALLIAAKNKHLDLVNFLIKNAMENHATRKILAEHLVVKTEEGKNVLHTAAINPNNEEIISILCNTAKFLHSNGISASQDLSNYINLPDSMYGSRALHFAARNGNFSNYVALVKENADVNIAADNGMIAIDLVRSLEPEKSIPFMVNWITKTDEGAANFKRRHVHSFNEISPTVSDALIKIDLDSGLTDNSRAQINACKQLIEAFEKAKTAKDYTALLTTVGGINFPQIDARDLQDDKTDLAKTLKKTLDKAAKITDKQTKNFYIQAELLRQFESLPEARKLAFDYYGYGELLKNYPDLALEGLKKFRSTEVNPVTFAIRLILAIAYQKSKSIAEKPQKSFAFFEKRKDAAFLETVNNFLESLRATTSIDEILKAINKLPEQDEIATLKREILSELKTEHLITAEDIPSIK